MRWSNKLAYAIGLIASDGSLSKDKRHIDFTSKDKKLINIFKKCLHLKNKIGKKSREKGKLKKYYRVQFSDVKLYKFLIKINLVERKSNRLKPLKIPSSKFFHFLRGYFDGDGSFYNYKDNRWPNSWLFYTTFYSESKSFLQWIKKILKEKLNIKGRLKRVPRCYELIYGKKESV